MPIELPSVIDVFKSLQHIHDNLEWTYFDRAANYAGEEHATIEVRLVVVDQHDWAVMTGAVDYDQFHGYCGAGAISKASDEVALRGCAQEMLDQIAEDIALAEGE